jgi:hypothetical protein
VVDGGEHAAALAVAADGVEEARVRALPGVQALLPLHVGGVRVRQLPAELGERVLGARDEHGEQSAAELGDALGEAGLHRALGARLADERLHRLLGHLLMGRAAERVVDGLLGARDLGVDGMRRGAAADDRPEHLLRGATHEADQALVRRQPPLQAIDARALALLLLEQDVPQLVERRAARRIERHAQLELALLEHAAVREVLVELGRLGVDVGGLRAGLLVRALELADRIRGAALDLHHSSLRTIEVSSLTRPRPP